MLSSLFVLAAAGLASAHFQLEYPSWRADSLSYDNYSQYDYPCANVPTGAWNSNRTDWSLSGGSLQLDLHHAWSYIFINIGLGDNVTNFNYSLTPSFLNETGKGTLCIDQLALPADLTPYDGQLASLQVVTSGESGAALYNCADITFRANVSAFGGANCTTDATITYSVVNEEVNGTTADDTSSSASASASASTTTTSGAASSPAGVRFTTLASVAALAVLAYMA